MFSNNLIKSIAKYSNEDILELSESDRKLVINANKNFIEEEEAWKGSQIWGEYLLNKIQHKRNDINFNNSLELCCGNGFVYFSLQKELKKAHNNYFTDLSSTQCKSFINRCNNKKVKTPIIFCSDILQLPFADNSLDLVYGYSFIHHLPSVPNFFNEIFRVLKPGGKFLAFHEPTPVAPFLETLPFSLIHKIPNDSLTDIWLLKDSVIEELLYVSGFSKIIINYDNLILSFTASPLQNLFVFFKIIISNDIIGKLRIYCSKLDKIIPLKLRRKYSPSISIYAEK